MPGSGVLLEVFKNPKRMSQAGARSGDDAALFVAGCGAWIG
jgi:hypothetical protein